MITQLSTARQRLVTTARRDSSTLKRLKNRLQQQRRNNDRTENLQISNAIAIPFSSLQEFQNLDRSCKRNRIPHPHEKGGPRSRIRCMRKLVKGYVQYLCKSVIYFLLWQRHNQVQEKAHQLSLFLFLFFIYRCYYSLKTATKSSPIFFVPRASLRQTLGRCGVY